MPDEETFETALDDLMDELWPAVGKLNASADLLGRLDGMRLVYADWLEERGDAHAAAQRWLVHRQKFPRYSGKSWDWWRYGDRPDCLAEDLPATIWDRLPGKPSDANRHCKEYPTRRSAERALYKALMLLNLLDQ